MKLGDKISWRGVNRIESGLLLREKGGGDWEVSLQNGKFVIVNQSSFIHG